MAEVQEPTREIIVQRIFHRDAFRLGLFFGFDDDLKQLTKSLKATYSKTFRCWYVDDVPDALDRLMAVFKGKVWVNYKDINGRLNEVEIKLVKQRYAATFKQSAQELPASREQQPESKLSVPKAYSELLKRRRYSFNTCKTYETMFLLFMRHHRGQDPETITEDQIRDYMMMLIMQRQISQSTQNQVINAIKFYYEHVLGLEKKKYWLERPRKEKKLPEIISEEQVIRLIAAANNLKHQCMIAMLYSAGLRRGELIRLRIQDVDFDRKQVWVRGGKGKKDRVTLLSEHLIFALTRYLGEFKPNYWMFEGLGRSQYSDNSVGEVVKQAARRAGLKRITPHMLRHSFATHLMDHGTDTRIIQSLLGHQSLETTQIYTHVTTRNLQNIVNPLDQIFASKHHQKRLREDDDRKK